ncbi:MAG: DUF928 domain-containing protein [Cyanophyceae cyanobacterium]
MIRLFTLPQRTPITVSRGRLVKASRRSQFSLSALFVSVLSVGLMAPQAIAAPEAPAVGKGNVEKSSVEKSSVETGNTQSLSWDLSESLSVAAKSSRVRFIPPDNARPRTTVGSGSRGRVRFAPPNAPAPTTTVGSGSRGRVRFAPPNAPAPTTTVGTGSRESVSDDALALLPPGSYTQTRNSRPSLMLYLPETGADRAFVSIQDLDGDYHHQTQVNLTEDNGIVEVSLPSDAPDLEVGRDYLWQVVFLAPEEQLAPDTPVLRTLISRVGDNAAIGVASLDDATLEGLTPAIALEQAVDLAEAGLWTDTLQVLANARRLNPDNAELAEEWSDLLVQVGLGDVASAPLLPVDAMVEN